MASPVTSEDSPEADAVAKKLGAISVSHWIAFLKTALPSLALGVPLLMGPVDWYLDGREAAFRDALIAEVGSEGGADGGSEGSADFKEELKSLKEELDELEAEHKGDIRSSPTAFENMSKLADLRERVVRLEALAGVDSRR